MRNWEIICPNGLITILAANQLEIDERGILKGVYARGGGVLWAFNKEEWLRVSERPKEISELMR